MSFQNSPIDVYAFNDLVEKIRKIDPKATIPPSTPTGYKQAHELWMKLSGPKWEKPNPKQQAWIDVNARQTKTAEKLAEFVRLDLVKYEDFELPSDDLSVEERVRALNVINSRLDTIWEERNWSPEYRAKVALHRVGSFKRKMKISRPAWRISNLPSDRCAAGFTLWSKSLG
jgi:hypothetical protein